MNGYVINYFNCFINSIFWDHPKLKVLQGFYWLILVLISCGKFLENVQSKLFGAEYNNYQLAKMQQWLCHWKPTRTLS